VAQTRDLGCVAGRHSFVKALEKFACVAAEDLAYVASGLHITKPVDELGQAEVAILGRLAFVAHRNTPSSGSVDCAIEGRLIAIITLSAREGESTPRGFGPAMLG